MKLLSLSYIATTSITDSHISRNSQKSNYPSALRPRKKMRPNYPLPMLEQKPTKHHSSNARKWPKRSDVKSARTAA